MVEKRAANKRIDVGSLEMETGEAVTIPDGIHRGTIKEVYGEKTPQGYLYAQADVVLDDFPEITLRYGCPLPKEGQKITPSTKLGRFLEAFGFRIAEGQSVKFPQIVERCKDAPISCEIENEEVEGKGTFARIVEDSIKPLK